MTQLEKGADRYTGRRREGDAPRPSDRLSLRLRLACGLIAAAAAPALAQRQATIELSNGETLHGALSLTAGSQLKIATADALRTLALDDVREMRFTPEKEIMEQRWRFVEAGRVEKEKWGALYPVRHLRASLWVTGGQPLTGHLYTTVLYIETPESTRKFILRAKDRGKDNQSFDDLVYPVRIAFEDAPPETQGDLSVAIDTAGVREVVTLTYGPLLRLPARLDPARPATVILPSTLGQRIFLASRTDDELRVGWPTNAPDNTLSKRLEAAVADARDFFDERKLLGTLRDGHDLYALVSLRRAGATTLGGAKTQPWRLGLWRWIENEDGNLMIAGRGYFFRGITAKDSPIPPTLLSTDLWQAANTATREHSP